MLQMKMTLDPMKYVDRDLVNILGGILETIGILKWNEQIFLQPQHVLTKCRPHPSSSRQQTGRRPPEACRSAGPPKIRN